MTIERDGFLSSQVDDHLGALAIELGETHKLVLKVNRFTVAVVQVLRESRTIDEDFFTFALLARTHGDFSAAAILAMRGLRAQSRAAARAAWESAYCCLAAAQRTVLRAAIQAPNAFPGQCEVRIYELIDSAHQEFRRQTGSALLTADLARGLAHSSISKVVRELASLPLTRINIAGLAKDLGIAETYAFIYRPLSQDAHPSATSIAHYAATGSDGKINGFRVGPDYFETEDTLQLAVAALLCALAGFMECFGTKNEHLEFTELKEEYGRIRGDTEAAFVREIESRKQAMNDKGTPAA